MPEKEIPSDTQFYSGKQPNVDFLKDHFYKEGRISREKALFILK